MSKIRVSRALWAATATCTLALAGGTDPSAAGATSSGAVFQAPSSEQLAGITHPELRRELLAMAREDQLARSSGR